MSAERHCIYRFETQAQWRTCAFAQVDRDSLGSDSGLRPLAPYAPTPTVFASPGANAPAATQFGETLWRDDHGRLYRLASGDDTPTIVPVPRSIALANRLVVTPRCWWVPGDDSTSLHCFDPETLARRLVVEIAGATIVDIAADGSEGVLALVARGAASEVVCVDCVGRAHRPVALDDAHRPSAMIFLTDPSRIVVLAADGSSLRWYSLEGGKVLFTRSTSAMAPCFTVNALGSDGRNRVLLAGVDGAAYGRRSHVLVLDADGNTIDDVGVDRRAYGDVRGVNATADRLSVATARGLLNFATATVVPDATAQVRCTLITPRLRAPAAPDGTRWLRVEALAELPPGTTLEIAAAAPDDAATKAFTDLLNSSQAESERVRKLTEDSRFWSTPIAFHGSGDPAGGIDVPFAAPLFDLHQEFIWARVTLVAPAGSALPTLSRLDVLYHGPTLMEHLPALYRGDDGEHPTFLRSLVGLLETTTQSLDSHIAAMGLHIAPASASPEWLDFVASWLGLPWDDAMTVDQKRTIVTRAADLARGRGTRAGLETLLDALVQGAPRRYRVVDVSADIGFAWVGGTACEGSALPSVLAGLPTARATILGSKATIGRMHLPCDAEPDDGAGRITGRIRVEVAASAGEKQRWADWFESVIADMIPATASLDLRWVGAIPRQTDVLDDTLRLEDVYAQPHLGTDATVGCVRLPERGMTLSATGTELDVRLQ
jgi:phage tail-like protein